MAGLVTLYFRRPLREQTGSIVLRTKGLTRAEDAWIPYWRSNALCMHRSLGEAVAERFGVELIQRASPRHFTVAEVAQVNEHSS